MKSVHFLFHDNLRSVFTNILQWLMRVVAPWLPHGKTSPVPASQVSGSRALSGEESIPESQTGTHVQVSRPLSGSSSRLAGLRPRPIGSQQRAVLAQGSSHHPAWPGWGVPSCWFPSPLPPGASAGPRNPWPGRMCGILEESSIIDNLCDTITSILSQRLIGRRPLLWGSPKMVVTAPGSSPPPTNIDWGV